MLSKIAFYVSINLCSFQLGRFSLFILMDKKTGGGEEHTPRANRAELVFVGGKGRVSTLIGTLILSISIL